MKWKITPKKSEDIIEQLLISRGLNSLKDQEKFFNPKISDYESDLKIPGIDKSCERILEAIKKEELIIIYGDYDVDGICATAILYKGLTSLGAKVLPYIPHREKEGYGLSRLGLEYARDSGAALVITVDNGITAIEQAKFAKDLGLDLIITDHHTTLYEKPEAFGIVHSVKMCGAAVAWCLVRNLVKKELLQELLQFAAIAEICDLMPLLGLGRAFVFEGLKILNKTENLGLLALINESGANLGEIGSYEVGFMLGPRINAMGRLEHAIDSLRLLCTKDSVKAKRLARLLCDTNSMRQQMTIDALDQAKLQVNEQNKIHVLASKDWSAGIIGLVAGRITDEYSRPAIVISIGSEISKGSARSIAGINIVEIIRKHSDILINVGGHPGAAGFSLLSKNVEMFKKRLAKYDLVLPEEEKVLNIDAEVQINKLTKNLIREISKFEPFGLDNKKPLLASYTMQVSDIRTVGNGKHLKGKADGIDFIAFGMGDLLGQIKSGQTIDLAYNLELDTYNGNDKLQLKVKDIKLP